MSDAGILRAAAAVVEAREATAPWLSGVRDGLLRLAEEKSRTEGDPECCWRCFERYGDPMSPLMIGCSECGNKRCPRATSHDRACTGSNEPGQEGSRYA